MVPRTASDDLQEEEQEEEQEEQQQEQQQERQPHDWECQPLGGLHQHQPQWHVIAPAEPGLNGTVWPMGLNVSCSVLASRHMIDGT